jgi:hypothetical protein
MFRLLAVIHSMVWLVVREFLDNQQRWWLLAEGHDVSYNGFYEDYSIFHNGVVLDDTDSLTLLQYSLVTTSIQKGRLLSARNAALQLQKARPECEQSISKIYKQHVDAYLSTNYNDFHDVVLSKIDEELQATITSSLLEELIRRSPKMDAIGCWNPADDDTNMDLVNASMIVLEKWDSCCSQIVAAAVPHQQQQEECFHVHPQTMKRARLCCDFYQESLSQLRLPALQEVSLNFRLRAPDYVLLLQVHQDGFLRKFDPSAVLWPTAYLLSLCISHPSNCGISEILDSAIRGGSQDAPSSSSTVVVSVELGAGVGLPSLALSHLLRHQPQQQTGVEIPVRQVLATDRALHALVLTHLNSQLAGLPVLVAHVADHSNLTQLIDLKQNNERFNNGTGFSIVLGSSLQSLFDYETHDPHHSLWSVLDTLLAESNPDAIAILAHAVNAVTPPRAPPPLPTSISTRTASKNVLFECIHRVSGNHFNMKTRSGDDSDFEISIYRRRKENEHKQRPVSDEL